MKRLGYLLTVCLLMVLQSASAASDASTRTRIFDHSFRSLKVSVENDFMAVPVIRNGADSHLVVSFDRIADDVSHLRYRILHCNAGWQRSGLLESEFVDGFNLAPVEDYAFSSNTFVHFVNYRIVLPNNDMMPLVSGNYLLQVFPEDDPDKTLLQARFCVSDEAMAVTGDVLSVTDRGVNDRYQQLEIMVDRLGYPVQNPVTDLIVTVEQNSDPATLRTLPPPMRVDGQRMIFEHQQQLIFDAGNEYRRFETVAVPQAGMHVDSTRFIDDRYNVFLQPDRERTHSYIYDQTQHGRFMIRESNASDSDLGADYVNVHFQLNIPEQPGAEVYVQGEMTDAFPQGASRMVYDPDVKAYTLTLPLKQGSYNYRYMLRAPGDELPLAAPIEGNHYQTRNEYTVKVYHRAPGARGDRLLAVYTLRNY